MKKLWAEAMTTTGRSGPTYHERMACFACQTCLSVRCGEQDASECVFWHCYGLTCVRTRQYQHWCECVTTSVSTHITQHGPTTLELDTWSDCRLSCTSSRLSVLLFRPKATCWIHNIKNLNRSIVTTFCGRSQQRDCVCQQPCTSRPLIHMCDHDSSHFPVCH